MQAAQPQFGARNFVPLAVLGSTAPDWLEWVLQAIGRRVAHRTVTHYVTYWVMRLMFGLVIWDFHYALTAFCAGGLSHVLCDALTVQGVPLGWWSGRRFHLFGGRFRTGQMGEYWFAGGFVLVCFGVAMFTRHWGGEYSPFFFDWAGYYKDGLIDAASGRRIGFGGYNEAHYLSIKSWTEWQHKTFGTGLQPTAPNGQIRFAK